MLPNFLTSLSLFCGFYAIVATMRGNYLQAAWAIIVSGLFDGLDGRIARMTNTTSKFGVEYDSLATLWLSALPPQCLPSAGSFQFGRWGWVAAFLLSPAAPFAWRALIS